MADMTEAEETTLELIRELTVLANRSANLLHSCEHRSANDSLIDGLRNAHGSLWRTVGLFAIAQATLHELDYGEHIK